MVNSQLSESKSDTSNTLNFYLFTRMNECIEHDKLFTQEDLSRERLCKLIGVDRNRFAAIIKEYSGARNLADYLNHKRINYALTLMKQHPEWTLLAICETAGMSESSFKRWFKGLYGVSPSEYRRKLLATGIPTGGKKKPLLTDRGTAGARV